MLPEAGKSAADTNCILIPRESVRLYKFSINAHSRNIYSFLFNKLVEKTAHIIPYEEFYSKLHMIIPTTSVIRRIALLNTQGVEQLKQLKT